MRRRRSSSTDHPASHRHGRGAPRTGHAEVLDLRGTASRSPMVPGRAYRGRGQQHPQGPAARRVAVVPGGGPEQTGIRFGDILVHRFQLVWRSHQQKSEPDRHL